MKKCNYFFLFENQKYRLISAKQNKVHLPDSFYLIIISYVFKNYSGGVKMIFDMMRCDEYVNLDPRLW